MTTLSFGDVVAINAALRAGKLSKVTGLRLRRLLAAQPPLAAKRGPGLPPADVRALQRAHALLAHLRAIVRHADEVEGLRTVLRSCSWVRGPLPLPGVIVNKWQNKDLVVVRRPDGQQRSVELGAHGSPEAAKRYREVVAEHLAEVFGRAT